MTRTEITKLIEKLQRIRESVAGNFTQTALAEIDDLISRLKARNDL